MQRSWTGRGEKSARSRRRHEEALKQALKEAAAAQYEQDELGRLQKARDPTKELMKKMRLVEAESRQAMIERDAELAAKEAAFQKAQKEAAEQRQRQMEEERRKVVATMRENEKKQLADKLKLKTAEKEKNREARCGGARQD